MCSLETFRLEPYRFLFLIGLFHLIFGIGLWVTFALGLSPYPGLEHARFMVEGFLLSFSLGFLMTAIPRFSRSAPAAWPEAIAAGLLAILAGVWDVAAVGALLFLVFFGIRRQLFSSKTKKPSFFIFVQAGMMFGLSGAIAKTFFPADLYLFKSWLYEGMMLLWLCGIGSRILVMLLEPKSEPLSPTQNRMVFAFLAIGIFIQPFGPTFGRMGDFLRVIAIGYLSFRVWNLHQLPFKRGALAWGVWCGISFLLFGHLVRLIHPLFGIHATHMIFIGGFTTLALMVSVRVSISHAGAFIIGFAALTRFSAGVLRPEFYTHHLTYAALTMLAAIPLWASVVVPRLFRDERPSS
jgi:uncharacterized protein involved in response to NO